MTKLISGKVSFTRWGRQVWSFSAYYSIFDALFSSISIGFDFDGNFHLAVGGAFVVASDGRHIGVIAAHGDFHISLIGLAIVRRVEGAPADAGHQDLHPGVRGAGDFRSEIATDIERRDFQRTTEADRNMCEVLADTAFLAQ